ncbi:MAG: hypothetical protein EPN91_02460 [Salinibacterium sp.]|nr:MAG: hypothetical protein EPN91_02460 [Salinibacterium sp.]
MAIPQGIDALLTLGWQTDFDTIAATGKIIAFLSEGISGNQPLIPNQQTGGDANSRASIVGRSMADGPISCYLTVDNFPLIMKAALGTFSSTGSGDPYTHTAKTTKGMLPFLTVEKFLDMDTDKYLQCIGECVDTFDITIEDQGYATAKLGMKGKKTQYADTSFDASPVDITDSPCFEFLQVAAADAKFNGSANARIQKADIKIANNVTDVFVVGHGGPRLALVRKRQVVSGTVDFIFDDMTVRDLITAATLVTMEFKMIQATNRSADLKIFDMRLEVNDPKIENDGPLMLHVPFLASKNTSAGTQITAVGVNSRAGTFYAP